MARNNHKATQIEGDREGEQTDAQTAAMKEHQGWGLTWLSISGAGEPALVTDQQFILYRRRIGLLECPSVMHPDDEGEKEPVWCERLQRLKALLNAVKSGK